MARSKRPSHWRKELQSSIEYGDYDDADSSAVFRSTVLAVLPFESGVRGEGVSVPVLGDVALRLNGLSSGGDTGLRPS